MTSSTTPPTSASSATLPPYGGGNGLFYLWHLQSIGLVSPDEDPTPEWTAFLQHDNAARIAIIDNGCTDIAHPNLPQSRIEDRMEFAGFLEGSVYGPQTAPRTWDGAHFGAAGIDLPVLLADHPKIGTHLRRTLEGLAAGPLTAHAYEDLQDPSKRFSAHGTSTAGLVAAEPVAADPATEAANARAYPTKLNYCGVNPLARIIPINTVYSASYAPVIMALLYAVAQNADVILMPRIVHDLGAGMSPKKIRDSRDPRVTRHMLQGRAGAERDLFEAVLAKVSDAIPVVVAAGNDGSADVKYPGSLKSETDATGASPHGNLFVAGAATALGSLASYSSGGASDGVTLMPSDDAQIINADFQRPDLQSWRSRNIDTDTPRPAPATDPFPHAPYGVLTLDIPGQYGYASQGRENTDYDDLFSDAGAGDLIEDAAGTRTQEAAFRSLYAVFGGTSAASAILAGLLSLCQNRYKSHAGAGARLTGTQMRHLVDAAGQSAFYVPLTTDASYDSPLQTIDIAGLLAQIDGATPAS